MTEKEPGIVVVYTPREGHFVIGVPQRDLTQTDVDSAGPTLMSNAYATGLYAPVKSSNPKPETKAEKAAREKAEAEAAAAAEAEAARLAAEAEVTNTESTDNESGGDESGEPPAEGETE